MLETTFSNEFVPGTNLSGGLASADWRFLLPRFPLERIVFLGLPPVSSLPALPSIGKVILVLSRDERQLRDIYSSGGQREPRTYSPSL